MILGGIEKTSFIDYPGKISTVLFFSECNFRCPYCHNPELVIRPYYPTSDMRNMDTVMSWIEMNQDKIESIVLSGGEPTIDSYIADLCHKIKRDYEFPIKLDTNGSRPDVIEYLINNNLIDYIAMDIKTSIGLYHHLAGFYFDSRCIIDSINIIKSSSIDYEFRTTCVKPFVTLSRLMSYSELLKGAKKFIIQKARNVHTLAPIGQYFTICNDSELEEIRDYFSLIVDVCKIR